MAKKGISRRQFIETSVMSAATAVGVQGLQAFNRESGRGTISGGLGSNPRLRIRWNEGWMFKRQASPGSGTEPEFVRAEQPGYDDSSWQQVWLPHTWDATPDNPFATTGHFRGVGWYRKRFEAPEPWRDRRVLALFNGAFQTADVWSTGGTWGGTWAGTRASLSILRTRLS